MVIEKDTVFISGKMVINMMDSGILINNQVEFLKMLKLEKIIKPFCKMENLYKILR